MELFKQPGFRDPLSFLQKEKRRHLNVSKLLYGLEKRYEEDYLYSLTIQLAGAVEPIDRSIGIDPEYPYAQNFLHGTTLGLHVIKNCVPKPVQEAIKRLSILVEVDETDEQQNISNVANQLVAYGDEGVILVPKVAELLDQWSEQITPDYRHQIFVRRGFGLLMHMTNAANNLAIGEEMERGSVSGTVDWNRALINLMK